MWVIFMFRESETECNKREEYYQSRQAELSKDYAAQVESIEEEYRTAVQQVREELGRSTTEAANSGNNAVEESKAKEEEESPVERFLRRIGYEEDAGRGVVCFLNDRNVINYLYCLYHKLKQSNFKLI